MNTRTTLDVAHLLALVQMEKIREQYRREFGDENADTDNSGNARYAQRGDTGTSEAVRNGFANVPTA